MNYLIYFDESNKIDQFNKEFSYYGAYSGTDKSLAMIVNKIRKIFKAANQPVSCIFVNIKKIYI